MDFRFAWCNQLAGRKISSGSRTGNNKIKRRTVGGGGGGPGKVTDRDGGKVFYITPRETLPTPLRDTKSDYKSKQLAVEEARQSRATALSLKSICTKNLHLGVIGKSTEHG